MQEKWKNETITIEYFIYEMKFWNWNGDFFRCLNIKTEYFEYLKWSIRWNQRIPLENEVSRSEYRNWKIIWPKVARTFTIKKTSEST